MPRLCSNQGYAAGLKQRQDLRMSWFRLILDLRGDTRLDQLGQRLQQDKSWRRSTTGAAWDIVSSALVSLLENGHHTNQLNQYQIERRFSARLIGSSKVKLWYNKSQHCDRVTATSRY